MKKQLLFLAALGFATAASAQEVRVETGRSSAMLVPHHAPGVNASVVQKSASAVQIGTSPNVYGFGFGPRTNMWANEELNTIAFIHRSDYSSNGDNSSGSLRYDVSTDGGATWTSNAGPVWNPSVSGYAYPGVARYPNMAIMNPDGNTNPLNAYVGFWAPTLTGHNAGSWGGALMGYHKLSNTVNGAMVDTSDGHLTLENMYADGSDFWGLSAIHRNYTATEFTDTIEVWHGEMDFTNDTMTFSKSYAVLPMTNTPSNGKLYGAGRVFFADDASTGFVAMMGYDSLHADAKVIHPILTKTTDAGDTWGAAFGPNLDLLVEQNSGDSLIDIFRNYTGWATIDHLTSNLSEFDMAVDANGNPHMLLNIFPGAGTVTQVGNSPAPDFNYYPAINFLVDVHSTDGGISWDALMIDTLYTFSYDFDPTNGPVGEDNRMHISMSTDRTKMFYSWFESDTAYVTAIPDNNFPDWFVAGYDVMGDSLFGGIAKMTELGECTWGNVADFAFDNGDGTYTLHMTYAPIADFGSFSALNSIDSYYMAGQFPASGIGVEENTLSFESSRLYPNPTNGNAFMRIQADAPATYNLHITDLSGRTVHNEVLQLESGLNTVHIDGTSWASGIYFTTLESNGQKTVQKLIVE